MSKTTITKEMKCESARGMHGACEHDLNTILQHYRPNEWSSCPKCELPWKFHAKFQIQDGIPTILHPTL